jgi:hypothetical protein
MQNVAPNAQELNLKPQSLKCDSCGQPISTDTSRHPDLGPSCADCLTRDEQCSRFEDFGYALADVLVPIFGHDRGLLLEVKDSLDCHLEIRAQELQQSGPVVDTTLELDRLPEHVEQEFAQKLAALLVGSCSTTLTARLREELDWAVRGGR